MVVCSICYPQISIEKNRCTELENKSYSAQSSERFPRNGFSIHRCCEKQKNKMFQVLLDVFFVSLNIVFKSIVCGKSMEKVFPRQGFSHLNLWKLCPWSGALIRSMPVPDLKIIGVCKVSYRHAFYLSDRRRKWLNVQWRPREWILLFKECHLIFHVVFEPLVIFL